MNENRILTSSKGHSNIQLRHGINAVECQYNGPDQHLMNWENLECGFTLTRQVPLRSGQLEVSMTTARLGPILT